MLSCPPSGTHSQPMHMLQSDSLGPVVHEGTVVEQALSNVQQAFACLDIFSKRVGQRAPSTGEIWGWICPPPSHKTLDPG